MSWSTKVVLVAAAIAVSAWLIAGPTIPPFQSLEAAPYGVAYADEPNDGADPIATRTASRQLGDIGMMAHTRRWRENHLIHYKSGRREAVTVANGFEFISGPMALTLALLLAVWSGVVLACRRKHQPTAAVNDAFVLSPRPQRRPQAPRVEPSRVATINHRQLDTPKIQKR